MLHVDFAKGFELPPYWLNHPVAIKNREELAEMKQEEALNAPMILPLEFKLSTEAESEYWKFPIEPIISLSSKNIIIRRSVAKKSDKGTRGTIKETWSQDDYEITIAGVFINGAGEFPETDLRKLRFFCEAQQTIDVRCPLFTIFNITKISIESFDLPFTKGQENQLFAIKAYSDDVYNLLIESK